MFTPVSEERSSYLHDESRLSGAAEDISFPRTAEEVCAIVRECLAAKKPITVAGARTGICGGAVPLRGHLMNMSEMNKVLTLSQDKGGVFYCTVEAGCALATLRRELRSRFTKAQEQFWPPDPSELTATIGGIAATNGRGPGAFKYGAAEHFIASIQMVTAGGEAREIQAGEDLWQHVIGGEGLFGAITALTLRLVPKPREIWGIAFFFNDEAGAAEFIDRAVSANLNPLAALDFLDAEALRLAGELKEVAAKLREIPSVPPEAKAAVYIELHADSEDEIEAAAGELMEAAEECGSNPDTSWALSGDETEKLRLFRHAVPEAINTRIDRIRLNFPGAVKMGGDLTMPGISFSRCLQGYRKDIGESGLFGVIFGHARDNHLHVNLLPHNEAERQKGLDLMARWLERGRELGGRLFLEHGVGKVKRELFSRCEDPKVVEAKRELKKRLDPHGLWNPGNVFSDVLECA